MKSAGKSVAIIGCGAVVEEAYTNALTRLSRNGWHLCFVDTNASRSAALADRFDRAGSTASITNVTGRVSHAVVSTPPASHYPICSALIEGGVHVLCEKPFVSDPNEGFALVRRAREAGLKLQVNQTRRWFPASLEAKRMISEHAIGEITSVTARSGTRFNWPTKTAFYSQPELTRNGILSDQGSHVFDLVGWILGRKLEPLDVQHDGYAGPETTVRVEFSLGPVRGTAVMTWLVTVPTRLEFIGTKGRLIIDDDCNRVLIQIGDETREISGAVRYANYQAIVSDVINSFVSGEEKPSVASAESVMPSVVFLDRAYQIGKATIPLVTTLGVASQ